MAAPRDATHSIKNCYKCGKEFDPPAKKGTVWMNITPSKANRMMHIALCDECYDEEGGVWWATNHAKSTRSEQ